MIIGDKIVTTHLTLDGRPVPVSVVAIEHGQIVWDLNFSSDGDIALKGRWYFEHVDALTYASRISAELLLYNARGRVSKRDRGITWCPAWIEREVELLSVVAGLRTIPL